MKKLIYGMVFFSIFGLLFSSCKKENKNFVNSQKQIETQNDNIIKNEVLQSEGELHNDLLDVMLSEVWDKNRDTAEYNFSNYCAQNNINANLIVPIDRSILYEPNEYIDFMENALSQCKNCDEQYSSFELTEISSFLDWINQSNNTKSLEEILYRIDSNVSKLKLSSEFSDRLETFYSIAYHTMTYWAPINQGGLGNFDKYPHSSALDEIDWYEVGYVDCVAGFFGGHLAAVAASVISIISQS